MTCMKKILILVMLLFTQECLGEEKIKLYNVKIGKCTSSLGEHGVFAQFNDALVNGLKRFPDYKEEIKYQFGRHEVLYASVICHIEESAEVTQQGLLFLEGKFPDTFDVPHWKIRVVSGAIFKKKTVKEENRCHMLFGYDTIY